MPNKSILLLFCVIFINAEAQWTKTNGPLGISVTSFYQLNDSTLLCGTNAKGVYRSYDNGDTWTASNSGLDKSWITCFSQDGAYLFAGTFDRGVYRSSDNGFTWTPANTGIANEAISCMDTGGIYLFAGTVLNGIYRSSDHGVTWTDINQNLLTQSYILSMIYHSPLLIVEADNYICYSTDFGNSWNVDQGITSFYQIDRFYENGDTLLACAGPCIFKSINGGNSWSGPSILNDAVSAFAELNDTLYALGEGGLYMSPDYGGIWNFISSPDIRPGARALEDFIISHNRFLCGFEEIGIYKSDNSGSNWSQVPLDQFVPASNIDDALTFYDGTVYSGTHTNGVHKSPDQGNSWTKIGTNDDHDTLSNEVIFSILHLGPDIILAGGCGNGLFRSADNGSTWTHITAGLPPDDGDFTCIKTLAQAGPNTLAALTNGVFYSTDSGLTWQPANINSLDILQTGGFAVRGNIVCVGVIGLPSISVTGVYRSTDYGINYVITDNIPDIETMASGGNHTMYCGELFTSYVSYDDGLTWNGLGLGAAFSILAWDNYAFIGNNDGVFFSDNYGASWSLQNTGFDPPINNEVQGLTRDSVYVYAGLYRNGVWKRPLSDFGIFTGITKDTEEHYLRIYPNPAQTIVHVFIDDAEEKTIVLSDIQGKELQSFLFTGTSLDIPADQFKSGNYVVKLKTKNRIINRRITIVH